ncbi:MAG: RnfH family protein [Gammaproteobacteria bacterium]|nr:RnfH family protein [Gammaproteobacteria bacterium]
MTNENVIGVEVAYARPEKQTIIRLEVPAGTTAMQAIRLSGITQMFPEISLGENKIGIFGKLCTEDRELKALDRVEIYRPLNADPKEVRRKLAAQGKTMGKKGGG